MSRQYNVDIEYDAGNTIIDIAHGLLLTHVVRTHLGCNRQSSSIIGDTLVAGVSGGLTLVGVSFIGIARKYYY